MKKLFLSTFGVALFITSCTSTSTGTTTTTPTPTIATPSATTENIAQGKTIYDNNCGKCHALPEVSKFSDEKWVGIMNWMAPKAKLTDEQKSFAYLYVSKSN